VCPDGSAIIFPINGVRVRTDRIFPVKTVNQSVWCEIYVDHERGTWDDLEATEGVFVFLKNGWVFLIWTGRFDEVIIGRSGVYLKLD
jgi:hypothetical protein